MDQSLYVMMMEKPKSYNRLTKAVIEDHVAHLKRLDESGKLELCGPLKGYPGMAGMVILKTESYEEADALCKQEPLVIGEYVTYKLVTLQVASKDNNYLL